MLSRNRKCGDTSADKTVAATRASAISIKARIYGLLGQLPGALGSRYRWRLERSEAGIKFDEAVIRSAGMTCIDLGANVGKYTRKMAVAAKCVIAFEPDPWAFAALRTNVAGLENVRLVNAAAGTSEQKVPLYRHARFEDEPARYSESSSICVDKNNVSEGNVIEVQQVDFLNYLENLNEPVGVLKIDIEGAEVDLLEALFDRPDILSRVGHIFAETHESRIPGHETRVRALRERARLISRPEINLGWR